MQQQRPSQKTLVVRLSCSDKAFVFHEEILPMFPRLLKALTDHKNQRKYGLQVMVEVPYSADLVTIVIEWAKKILHPSTSEETASWEKEFLKTHFDKMVSLMPVAYFLEQFKLAESIGKLIADHLKGKSPQMVASYLGIVCDLTESEMNSLKEETEGFDIQNHQ